MNRNTLKASFGALAIAGLFSFSSCTPDPVEPPTPTVIDYCGDVNAATTWTNRNEGLDYRVTCDFTINADMVIEEGTEIEFANGKGVIVSHDGSLWVKGTADKMVTIHGTGMAAGSWKGIWFQSNDDKNTLDYCMLSGGGQGSFNGHDIRANVRVSLNAGVGITNSTISGSGRDGLYIEGLDDAFDNPLRVFSNNTFSNNANFPITTISSTISRLDGTGSDYTANGNQHIEIRGGRVYGTHSWVKNTIPFLVSGEIRAGYYTDEGNLTINAGVAMEFINDFGITIGEYSAGYLRMVGTASEPVSLTTGEADAWQGVCFQSTNPSNMLSYVNINRGGGAPFTGAATKKGNVVIGGFSAGSATIQNCAITNSAAYGIFVAFGSTPPASLPGVTYSGNAQANYYVEP